MNKKINLTKNTILSLLFGSISVICFISIWIKNFPSFLVLLPIVTAPLGIVFGLKEIKSNQKTFPMIGIALNVAWGAAMLVLLLTKLF